MYLVMAQYHDSMGVVDFNTGTIDLSVETINNLKKYYKWEEKLPHPRRGPYRYPVFFMSKSDAEALNVRKFFCVSLSNWIH